MRRPPLINLQVTFRNHRLSNPLLSSVLAFHPNLNARSATFAALLKRLHIACFSGNSPASSSRRPDFCSLTNASVVRTECPLAMISLHKKDSCRSRLVMAKSARHGRLISAPRAQRFAPPAGSSKRPNQVSSRSSGLARGGQPTAHAFHLKAVQVILKAMCLFDRFRSVRWIFSTRARFKDLLIVEVYTWTGTSLTPAASAAAAAARRNQLVAITDRTHNERL